MIILIIIILSIISGIFYRCGGSSKFNTKFRDLGCPTIMLIAMAVLGNHHWSLLLCFGLLFASLTTYFKRKGKDSEWYNWLLVGLAISLSMLPWAYLTGHLHGFYLRSFILTLGITSWSEAVDNDVLEEFGRGLLIIATLPILFS